MDTWCLVQVSSSTKCHCFFISCCPGKPSSDLESSPKVKSSTETNEATSDDKNGVDDDTVQSKAEPVPVVSNPEQPSEKRKPRLVIRIKHGAVCYNSVTEWMETNHHDFTENHQKSVPYSGSFGDEDKSLKQGVTADANAVGETDLKSSKKSEKEVKQNSEPVVARCLETTTSVPGCYEALENGFLDGST